MTDAERAALLRLIEYPAGPGLRVTTPEGAEAILRVVEGPIRADERARVVAEATTDEAVRAAMAIYWANPQWRADMGDSQRYRLLAMRSAIRAVLEAKP